MPLDETLTPAYAIVPAAGRSLRMGAPKLLLPWGDGTILDAVLKAWSASRVAATIVVTHPDDHALRQIAARHGALAVTADTPPLDMKASVSLGLDYVKTHFQPQAGDLWLLAPADMPTLSPNVIDAVIAAAVSAPEPIVAPSFQGQRGHPVAFRWTLADEIASLRADQGVNALLKRHPVRLIELSYPAVLEDLDTPDEYRVRYLREHPANP